ncbi:MAG: protein adenylyltransferase Fic [Planctomycetota bacterium]|jgi:Fic family protein
MNTTPWKPDRPYNDLPPLPSAEILETRPVLRACVESRAALAGLKQAAELIPNQSMLINTLPVLEARDSSAVENIVTTTDKLFKNLHAEASADPATKEALRYRRSLMEGYQSLNEIPLCTRMAEVVCSTIRDQDMRVRKVPGTKLANSATGDTIYTPPEGEATIRGLLAGWETFMNDEKELDPLIRMAAGHYQFEAIHPFTDGNGRTGRVLNSLFLIQEGLLSMPILYLSRHIIRHKDAYYDRLIKVTRHEAWESWLLYMLEAVRETSKWTLAKIEAIRNLADTTAERVRDNLPKIYSRELIDEVFTQPYCRIDNLVQRGIAKRQTASRYLKLLVEIGVLEERKIGREKLFVNPHLLSLLADEGETS